MRKQQMLILTGLPYAGKTTLRNELVGRFGFSSVSVDEVIDRRGFDTTKMNQDNWNTAYSEAYDNLHNRLKAGESVIVDIGNLKKSERDTARAIAQEYAVQSKLIYINTPRDEIMSRWKRNQETHERGHVDDSLMQRAFNMFEAPTPDESPIFYNKTMDLNDWIRTNIDGAQARIEQNTATLK